MRKLRIMTVVGTRPEIIRLSRVIPALDAATDHILIHTGQNYDFELNEVFFSDLGIRRPNHFLGCGGGSAAEVVGKIISSVDMVLENERPDALLVLGDTNSCLSVLAAKRRHIPIFHMEAGNRCFDERVPEEMNRRIVDHVADFNLPYTAIAREYLLAEGRPADRIVVTGSPMREVLEHNRLAAEQSDILGRLGLSSGQYFVVSTHREENIEPVASFNRLTTLLDTLADRFGLPVIVSTHPRTRNRINATGHLFHQGVRLLKPLGFHDYIHLQMHSRAVLSDSGTISEESSILGFPALNIREAHERPEAMEQGVVMMTGNSVERVMQALTVLELANSRSVRPAPVPDYAPSAVSEVVVRLIISYTDYIRRKVWQEGT